MHSRRAFGALALMTLAAPALGQSTIPGVQPEQIATIFCLSRTTLDTGLIAGLLSPELAATIAEAEALDAAWAAANPGEKPPLGDGIPWQSWQDYADTCTPGTVTYDTDAASVELVYGFADAPEIVLRDHLYLRLMLLRPEDSEPVWRIDDVGFEAGGYLRHTLDETISGY